MGAGRLARALLLSLCLTAAAAGRAVAADVGVADAGSSKGTRLAQVSSGAGRWLLERLAVDLGVVGAWRTAWAAGPHLGFHVGGGGAELNLGLEFESGWAVLLGGRVMAGTTSPESTGSGRSYLEATGQIGAQLRLLEWARLELGATLGPMYYGDASAVLLGGFLRMGVDWLPRSAPLLKALTLWFRLDMDGHLDRSSGDPAGAADPGLPGASLGLSLGLGLRL